MNVKTRPATQAEIRETAPPRPPMRGTTIAVQTLGEAWLDVSRLILTHGVGSSFKGKPNLETELVTLEISHPDPDDAVIADNAPPDWLAWMRKNFTDHSRVAELGGARSYASRLFDYAGVGRNQLDWVVEKLTSDPIASYASITTFEPLTDTTYIPCVSLLDFWLRSNRLELIAYAHTIDFGNKGFANLVQLAELQRHVAERLGVSAGNLVFIIKSATIYVSEAESMRKVVAAARGR